MKFFQILILLCMGVTGVPLLAAQTEGLRSNTSVPEPRRIVVTMRGSAIVNGNLIKLDPDKLEIVGDNGLRIISVNDIAAITFDHTTAGRAVVPPSAEAHAMAAPAALAEPAPVVAVPQPAPARQQQAQDTPRGYTKPHDKSSRRGSREAARKMEDINGPAADVTTSDEATDEGRPNPNTNPNTVTTGRVRTVSAPPPVDFSAADEEARIARERADSLRKEQESRARIERARLEMTRAKDRKERAARDRAERERQDRLARERKDREEAAQALKNKARDAKKDSSVKGKTDSRDRKRGDDKKSGNDKSDKNSKETRGQSKKTERDTKDSKKDVKDTKKKDTVRKRKN